MQALQQISTQADFSSTLNRGWKLPPPTHTTCQSRSATSSEFPKTTQATFRPGMKWSTVDSFHPPSHTMSETRSWSGAGSRHPDLKMMSSNRTAAIGYTSPHSSHSDSAGLQSSLLVFRPRTDEPSTRCSLRPTSSGDSNAPAPNSSSMDSGNFVGITTDPKLAKAMTLPKPPTAPTAPGTTSGAVELSVIGDFDGQTMKMSQAVPDNLTKKEYALQVKSESAGHVTVTWPNLATLPKKHSSQARRPCNWHNQGPESCLQLHVRNEPARNPRVQLVWKQAALRRQSSETRWSADQHETSTVQ